MKRAVVIFIAFSFIFSALAQVKNDVKNDAKKGLENTEIISPYTYQPKSKRDPFISPFDLEVLKSGKKKKVPGIAGMSIDEIVLQGIIITF